MSKHRRRRLSSRSDSASAPQAAHGARELRIDPLERRSLLSAAGPGVPPPVATPVSFDVAPAAVIVPMTPGSLSIDGDANGVSTPSPVHPFPSLHDGAGGSADDSTDKPGTEADKDVGTPGVGTPGVGTPDGGTPDDGTPDDGTPVEGTPGSSGDHAGGATDGSADGASPDTGTPDSQSPGNASPDAGTSDDGTPDDGSVDGPGSSDDDSDGDSTGTNVGSHSDDDDTDDDTPPSHSGSDHSGSDHSGSDHSGHHHHSGGGLHPSDVPPGGSGGSGNGGGTNGGGTNDGGSAGSDKPSTDPATDKPSTGDAGDGGPHAFPPLNPNRPPTDASSPGVSTSPSSVGSGSSGDGRAEPPSSATSDRVPASTNISQPYVAAARPAGASVNASPFNASPFNASPVSAEVLSSGGAAASSPGALTSVVRSPASSTVFADRAPVNTVVFDASEEPLTAVPTRVDHAALLNMLASQASSFSGLVSRWFGDWATAGLPEGEVVDLDSLRALGSLSPTVLGLARGSHHVHAKATDWVWKMTAGVSLAVAVCGYWYCSEMAARDRRLAEAASRQPISSLSRRRRELSI